LLKCLFPLVTKGLAYGNASASLCLEEVDAAKREASDAKSLLRGPVTVGVLPTIAPYLLPQVMAPFTKTFPGATARPLKLTLAWPDSRDWPPVHV